jgi:hypothetical protein
VQLIDATLATPVHAQHLPALSTLLDRRNGAFLKTGCYGLDITWLDADLNADGMFIPIPRTLRVIKSHDLQNPCRANSPGSRTVHHNGW